MESGIFSYERSAEAIPASFRQFADQLAIYLPQLLAGIAILLLGWLLAYLFSRLARRLIQGLDFVFTRLARAGVGDQLKTRYARIIEKVVFWVTIVFFITVSANVLGWTLFSRWMDSVVSYLPGLLTGLLIIMVGFVLANFTRSAIMTAALKSGIGQSSMMARSAQIIIIFSAVIIGVEQIGLDVDFLSTLIVVITGTLFAGAALAFAFGAKTLVANLLGAQYSRKHCRLGETLRIGEVEGRVIEITQLSIVLDTVEGRAVIPAKQFNELTTMHRASQASDAGEQL